MPPPPTSSPCPPVILTLAQSQLLVGAQPLTREAFSPFGDVIENPDVDLLPSAFASRARSDDAVSASRDGGRSGHAPVLANQGSALKYQRVCRPRDLYASAPSGMAGEAVMSVFVCEARSLQSLKGGKEGDEAFGVEILERHPFTTQIFLPLGCSSEKRYLVIVAPSLAPSQRDEHLAVPRGEDRDLPGRGLPDVQGLRAFVARPGQGVLYGAGTWHAPMAALGDVGSGGGAGGGGGSIAFAVAQWANGVAGEDCQEVCFEGGKIAVRIPVGLRGGLARL